MAYTVNGADLENIRKPRAGQDYDFYAAAAKDFVDDVLGGTNLSDSRKKTIAIFYGVYLANTENPQTRSRSIGPLSSQDAREPDVDPYLNSAISFAYPFGNRLRAAAEGTGKAQAVFLSPAIEDADL